MLRSPKTLVMAIAGAAVIITVLLAIIFILILPRASTTGKMTPQAAASKSPTTTVDAVLDPSPAQGWVKVPDLVSAQSVAFSLSTPLVGYACGKAQASGSNATVTIWDTHNGGRTWIIAGSATVSTASAPATQMDCKIGVSPTNLQDIIIEISNGCTGCTAVMEPDFYRSLDSGKTWAKLVLPTGNEGTKYPNVTGYAWAGSTLFISAEVWQGFPDHTTNHHLIAASSGGSAFRWIDQNANIGGFDSMFGWNEKLCLIVLADNMSQLYMVTTNNAGATWQRYLLGEGSGNITPSLDGKILISFDLSNHFRKSVDGGVTWTNLPNFPQEVKYQDWYDIFTTPDGTIYCDFPLSQGSISESIYSTTQSQTDWTQVAPLSQGRLDNLTTSLNSQGHAVAIWGATSEGIFYHAA
jgi:hypothetical protein